MFGKILSINIATIISVSLAFDTRRQRLTETVSICYEIRSLKSHYIEFHSLIICYNEFHSLTDNLFKLIFTHRSMICLS